MLVTVNCKYANEEEFHENLDEGNFRLLQEKVFRILHETTPTPQRAPRPRGRRQNGRRPDTQTQGRYSNV